MGGMELLLMKYFVDNSKITELILTSGPRTRTSEVRYSHVGAPNDPPSPSLFQAAISCQHGPGAEYRRFSTKKWHGIWRYA